MRRGGEGEMGRGGEGEMRRGEHRNESKIFFFSVLSALSLLSSLSSRVPSQNYLCNARNALGGE